MKTIHRSNIKSFANLKPSVENDENRATNILYDPLKSSRRDTRKRSESKGRKNRFDIAEYKLDAAKMLNNRLVRKIKEAFEMISEFADFQAELTAHTKYDSQFDVGAAFQ